MPKNNRKDILCGQIDSSFLSLLSHKINVLIVGGGRAGFIKTKTLSERGCNVTVISKEFCEKFNSFENASNVNFINTEYEKQYILKNHIIVIATDDDETNENIMKDCSEECKLYLNCSDFSKGLFVIPCQRKTKSVNFAINTKGGSPKTSIYLADKIKYDLEKYDGFIKYNYNLRNKIENLDIKNEIMEFVASDDFYFFYKKDAYENILKMFYGGNDFEFKSSY